MANYGFYGPNYANPYVNYTGYQQPMPQPQIQSTGQMQGQTQNVQPIQNYSPAINQSGIIWISGLQEAQMFPIAPNAAVALWQKDGKTIFLKSADATGRPSLKIYDLVERAEESTEVTANKDVSVPAYAKEEDLGKLAGVVKSMNDIISNLKSDIDVMRGDLYGAVGKRKPVKKVEAETEE